MRENGDSTARGRALVKPRVGCLMRVLLETKAVPTVCTMPDGKRYAGSSCFQLFAFDPDEELPGHGMQRPVSAWRKDLIPGEDAFRMSAPEAFEGATAVAVPRGLLESLRDTDLLAFNWTFVPAPEAVVAAA